jgi:hypothetical protein
MEENVSAPHDRNRRRLVGERGVMPSDHLQASPGERVKDIHKDESVDMSKA